MWFLFRHDITLYKLITNLQWQLDTPPNEIRGCILIFIHKKNKTFNSETCLERPLLWKTTLFVRPLDNVTTLKVVSSSKTSVYTCGLGGQGVEVVILFCFNLPPNIESFLWKKFLIFPLKKKDIIFSQYGCFELCQFRPRSVFFLSWRLNKSAGDFRCLRYYCSQGNWHRTASDKFPGGPVVFVNSPDRLSGKLFSQPLPLRIDKLRFSVNST